MGVKITKKPAVVEDLDLGTGTNDRGTLINASELPMTDGRNIEEAINEITDPAGTPDPRYALHGGDLNVPFMVGLRSPAPSVALHHSVMTLYAIQSSTLKLIRQN